MGNEMPVLLIILLIVVVGMILYIVFNARNKADGAYERVMNLSKNKRFTGGDNRQMVVYLNKIWKGLCADTPVFYSLAAKNDGGLDITAETTAVNNLIGELIPMPTGTVFGKGKGVESANFTPIQVTSENKQQILDIIAGSNGLDPLNHMLNPKEEGKPESEYRNEIRVILNGIRQCLSRPTADKERELAEQQQKERELAEQQQKERELVEQQQKERELAEQQQKERELVEQQQKEQADKERELAEQQPPRETALNKAENLTDDDLELPEDWAMSKGLDISNPGTAAKRALKDLTGKNPSSIEDARTVYDKSQGTTKNSNAARLVGNNPT